MGGDAYEVIAWARPDSAPSPTSLRPPLPFLRQMPSEAQHFLLLSGSYGLLCPRCPPVPQCCPLLVCLSLCPMSSHLLPFPHSVSQSFLAPLSCPEPCTSLYPLSSCVLWPFLGPRPISNPAPGLPIHLLDHCCQPGAKTEVHFITVSQLS